VVLRVAVDFGTSSTCTAVSIDDRQPQVVVIDGAPLVPSSVYVTSDGTLFVGHEADRQAAVDPSRYEPHPKRRIDEGELLLGDTVLPVLGVVRAVLSRAVREARHLAANAAVDQLVLTHPADWGAPRTGKLRRAASGFAADIVLVPEPVAAAVFHAANHNVPVGAALAVLDLGGGTVDASVVRREAGGSFQVLSARGDPTFGGADIDQAMLEHVGAQVAQTDPDAWRRLVEGRELADRRRRRVLRQDVRGAKETLSRHTYTDVPMPPPFPDAHVTRTGLESLIQAQLVRTIGLLADAVAQAGLRPDQLAGVFLVGGSSRIPMVSRLLHERLAVVPVTLDQPETVVARGALRAVLADRHAARDTRRDTRRDAGRDALRIAAPTSPHGSAAAPMLPRPSPPVPRVSPSPLVMPPSGYPALGRTGQAGPARRSRLPWFVGGGAVLAAAVVVTFLVALSSGNPPAPAGTETEIAAFHYAFTAPQGWERSGGNAQARETDLRPAGNADTADKILVKEFELSYDASADRDRAVQQLRDQYDRRRATSDPPAVDGFDDTTRFAGKDVLYYNERVSAGTVDWYVLFQGRYQVSVGCQHSDSTRERVRTACDSVVGSLTVHR
jgi:molecular chaperone DnaK